MQIYLVRHPKPRDAAGVCYGRQDIAVDSDSLEQAAAAAREAIPGWALQGARVFSSPSQRCVLLARELAAPREPTESDELLEMSFGDWEGRNWEALPRDQLDAWAADVWGYRPGGAESAAMVAARWRRWSAHLVRYLWDRTPGRTMNTSVVAVTHAGVIRVALACAGQLNTATFAQAAIGFGSVHCVDVEMGATRASAPGRGKP